ncbi:MAG TPA: transketolase C-terminal domain-containing protein [Pirellulales bacterium]|nr:transketolase C-terminal domain-containing protein [Pirellulales bacterium]
MPRSSRLIGENLWRLTTNLESSGATVGHSDLLDAVSQVFDARHDRLISAAAESTWRLSQRDGRMLRFDPEHREEGFIGAWGDESPDSDASNERSAPSRVNAAMPCEPAKAALIKALGALQARDTLDLEHWVIVAVDANMASVALPPEQLDRLRRSSRLLILWCEEEFDCQGNGARQSPAAIALEQLTGEPGLICLGPIGGLAMDGVVAVLEALKALEQPALLHLRLKREPTPALASPPAPASQLAAQRMVRLARDDRSVFAVNLSGDASWQTFAHEFPDRFLEAPAGDSDAIGWCAGLADGGCRPFIALDEATLLRYSGRIAEEIGEQKRPITLIVSTERPATVERGREEGLFLTGEIAVMVPSDAAELEQMLFCAATCNSPVAIWLPAALSESRPANSAEESPAPAEIEFGRAALLRSGVDVALLAIGPGVSLACEAADQLSVRGVSPAVLNLRFARPLDNAAIQETVRGARAVAIIDEGLAHVTAGAALDILASLEGERPAAVIGSQFVRDRRRSCDQSNPGEPSLPQSDYIARHCLKLLESAGPLVSDSFQDAYPARPLPSTNPTHTAQDERRQILAREFSPTVAAWIRDYAEVGERSLYLWRWCLHGVGLTTLPCVSEELREHACDTKFLSGMLNVLLDDVSDRKRNGDLLDELLKVTGGCAGDFRRFSPADRQYAELTSRLWNEFWERVRGYPHYAAYKDLLQYDLTQLFNTVRYSHLINDNLFLLNLIEHDNYSPQGMGVMSFSTVDLMCSDRFPRHELAALREAVWHAQWMARIGNLITTWQREIGDGDYSSGVFARAVGRRDLTIEQLRSGKPDEIEAGVRRGEHETHFVRRWNYHRERLRSMRPCIQTFDLNLVVEGLERLLLTELGSRGRK